MFYLNANMFEKVCVNIISNSLQYNIQFKFTEV